VQLSFRSSAPLPIPAIRAHSLPMLASIPWVIEPEDDDMEKVF